MNTLEKILLAATLLAMIGCGLPPPTQDEDEDFPVELVIENRLDLLVQVGEGFSNEWTDIAPGETKKVTTKVRAGMKKSSVSMRVPDLRAFTAPRSQGVVQNDWSSGATVKFRGNVSGIHELPTASDGKAGSAFMTREWRLYFFAPAEDTAVFLARSAAPSATMHPTDAFTEDGVNWWRMEGPTSLVNQGYEFGRDDATRELVCERIGCFDK